MIDPLKYSNQLLVDFSNQMQSCSATRLIKQFETRTSHLSGFFDFLFGIGYEIYAEGIILKAFNNVIYAGATLSCVDYGKEIGILISELFNYKSPVNDPLKMVKKFNN